MKEIRTDRTDVSQLIDAVKDVEDEIKDECLGWRGNTLSVAFSGAGTVITDHKLGKTPTGWIIVDRDTAATVYRSAWDSNTISLVAGGAINIKVMVYV